MTKRTICPKCEAANARATEALGLLTHWQGRAADLEAALASFLRAPSVGSKGPGSITIEVQTFNREAAMKLIEGSAK